MTGRQLYPNPVQDDEVDILLILGNIVNFLKKNLKTFILCSIIGVVGGVISFYLLPRSYKISMLADSSILNGEEVITIIASWQTLLEKKEIELLANKLNVSPAVIKTIKKIEAEKSKKIVSDDKREAFLIKAEVFNNSSLNVLQAGIIYNLKNNEYVRKRVETKIENLELLKAKIKNEISQLDSIKLSIKKLIKEGGSNTNAFLTDPGNINLQSVSLYERTLQIDEEIRFVDEIQIIESFTAFKKPDSPKLVICVLGGLFMGLISAVIYIIIKNVKKRLEQLPA